MNHDAEKACKVCGATEETVRLETCPTCIAPFCADCGVRGLGRRFCTDGCARAFYFLGDTDDDEDTRYDD